MPVTTTYFPLGDSSSRFSMSSLILALVDPYGLNSSGRIPASFAISVIGRGLIVCAISRSLGTGTCGWSFLAGIFFSWRWEQKCKYFFVGGMFDKRNVNLLD